MDWKEALVAIERKNKLLNAYDVVEEARSKDSPLHDKFEWDNTIAGQKWRIHQARNLINVYYTTINTDAGETEPCRVFVSLKDDRYDEGGYRTMVSVMNDVELRNKLLNDAKEDLVSFKLKYNQLKELALVFEAIDKVV
jgi:hypothetical protein